MKIFYLKSPTLLPIYQPIARPDSLVSAITDLFPRILRQVTTSDFLNYSDSLQVFTSYDWRVVNDQEDDSWLSKTVPKPGEIVQFSKSGRVVGMGLPAAAADPQI